MTIQSYLVYPEPGRVKSVEQALHSVAGCEVTPALNEDLLVLVTESADEDAQRQLEAHVEAIDGISCLAMVGGWSA